MAPAQDAVLAKALYEAFLSAALAMGDDIKNLSWFGRNVSDAAKAAA